jgi:hypothetical protein
MEWIDGNIGSKVTMKYPSVILAGEHARGETLSVAFAGEGQHQDAGAKMVHAAPETTSKIVSKSISKDGGKTSYRGLVRVEDGAHGCKSHVQCDALILDEDSISDTYPYIEIEEQDVSIGHEASVSKIGEEQLEWLRHDLGAHKGMPTVVMMHIAAFCHSPQLTGNPEVKAYNGLVISDNNALREILERHKVKVVLQGHTHQNEDFRWNDVWYVTSQSVSAAWWGGNWRGFNPGYTVFTAHEDGRITWERVHYAWEHRLEPEDTLEQRRILERADFEQAQRDLYLKEIGAR